MYSAVLWQITPSSIVKDGVNIAQWTKNNTINNNTITANRDGYFGSKPRH
ncbi:hypothetical protein [uncultured Methanobacterium sp.]|nr:hypothetical protein [uncultured Methanobacterium sp.]